MVSTIMSLRSARADEKQTVPPEEIFSKMKKKAKGEQSLLMNVRKLDRSKAKTPNLA